MASKLPHHQVSSRGQRGIRFCLFFCSQKAKTSSDKPLIFKNIQTPILATLLDSYPYKLVGVFFPNPKNPDRLPICARTRIPVSPFLSCAYFTVLCTPRGVGVPRVGSPSRAVISCPAAPYLLSRDSKNVNPTHLSPYVAAMDPAPNRWYIACHTEGLTSSSSANTSLSGGLTGGPTRSPSPSPITKRKRAHMLNRLRAGAAIAILACTAAASL